MQLRKTLKIASHLHQNIWSTKSRKGSGRSVIKALREDATHFVLSNMYKTNLRFWAIWELYIDFRSESISGLSNISIVCVYCKYEAYLYKLWVDGSIRTTYFEVCVKIDCSVEFNFQKYITNLRTTTRIRATARCDNQDHANLRSLFSQYVLVI